MKNFLRGLILGLLIMKGELMAGIDAGAVAQKITTETGLEYIDHKIGDGEEAAAGMEVEVHYEGRLEDGTVFDSSYKRGEPLKFPLGAGYVIQGWDQGISGMKVGGERELIIPAKLGYGDRGAGGVIPGGATLIFKTELVGVSQK